MITSNRPNNMLRFWQFGCWNNLNTTIKKDKLKALGCLKDVIKLINERSSIIETKPDFLIISGDNYYPNKTKPKDENDQTQKKKIIFSEKLRQGFNSLPSTIPIYMILGNHDLETNNEGNLYIHNQGTPETLETPENKDCEIIQLELDTLLQKENIEYFFFKAKLLNPETLILMIDTSIYEIDGESSMYLPCYNKFFQNNKLYKNENMKPFDDIKKLRSYQLHKIMKAIKTNTNIKHLIIVGHHPIYQLKKKKDTIPPIKYISDIHINFVPVLKNIFEILQDDVKYYYLCSDLHLFQRGKIQIIIKTLATKALAQTQRKSQTQRRSQTQRKSQTQQISQTQRKSQTQEQEEYKIMEIQQFIVGTGGTELDDKLVDDTSIEINRTYKERNVIYTFEEEQQECGFLECTITNGQPNFEFISTLLLTGGKKYKNKTNKHKKKLRIFKNKTKKHKKKSKI